ncbi:hypothetical protein [Geodermatophilus sp. CPCC 205506]|uniref:hypothetical protein n=1 Tax=Geodermatophilus sp. CPCC 205506 TaxID=2936596 RepID=UPI003EEFB3B6
MRLDEHVLLALEAGLLSVPEAVEALSTLLAGYDEQSREEIALRLSPWRDAAYASQAEPRHDVIRDATGKPEPQVATRERLLRSLSTRGTSLLDVEDRRISDSISSLSYLRSRNAVIVLVQPGRVAVPEFQFQLLDDVAVPRLTVRRCNANLLAGEDPWGALSWWVSSSGYLSGRAPVDLLESPEENLLVELAASMTEIAG